MSEKVTTGIAGIHLPTIQQTLTDSTSTSGLAATPLQVDIAGDLALELANQALAAAEEMLAAAEAAQSAAAAAIGAEAAVPASLFLKLPLPFGDVVTPPEIALPVIEGSATTTEGDEETQAMFAALQDVSQKQAAMGEAVFATLDPILQGLDNVAIFTAADIAIAANAIEDEPTRCPIPATDAVPSIARMQLFDELLYAMRRAGMSAGAEDPEAPGKILCAYQALAIEKFIRRAVIKVSLPDDKVISLTSDLNSFGKNAAAASSNGFSDQVALTEYTTTTNGIPNGEYSLLSADQMLGFNIVPQLNFFGGIETLKDYGYNFDHSGDSSGMYRPDEGETPLVNLQAILMTLNNGINFI